MAYGQSRIISVVSGNSDTDIVSLQEAKTFLDVTTTRFDSQITSQITAARAMAEKYINRDILPREREQFIFEDETTDRKIELYGTPINSSEDITITIDGEDTTEGNEWKKIGLEYDQQIELQSDNQRNIKITYQTAGLVNDESVKQGILAILKEIFEFGQVQNKWVWATLTPLKKPFV